MTSTKLLIFKQDYNENAQATNDAQMLELTDIASKIEKPNQDNVSYHVQIAKTDTVHFYADFDNETSKNIMELRGDICEFLRITPNKVFLTENKGKPFSYHLHIPSIRATSTLVLQYMTAIAERYKWEPQTFDTSVYSTNRCWRLPNQWKPSQKASGKEYSPHPHIPKSVLGSKPPIINFIPHYTTDDACALAPLAPKSPPPKDYPSLMPDPTTNVRADEVWDYLNIISPETTYEYKTWIAIGTAIKVEMCGDEATGLKLYKSVSEKAANYDEDAVERMYDEICTRDYKDANMGCIRNHAKRDNPVEYAKIRAKWDATRTNYFMPADIFSKGMREMCVAISTELFKSMRYCLDKWYVFDSKTCLWGVIKNPSGRFIELFNKYFNYNVKRISKELMKDGLDDTQKAKLTVDRNAFISACVKYDTCGNHSVMKTHFSDLLLDNHFVEKLDILIDCFAFDDGIYNFKKGGFERGIRYDHYLTEKLPFAYAKACPHAYERVDKAIRQICSMEEWRYKYYKTLLGYCMTGRAHEQQAFYSMTGLGSNGKSFIFERLSAIFKPYVCTLPSNTFERGCKDYNKNISLIIGKRLAWINELSKKTCDADIIKSFSDGTAMNIPYLYQQHPVSIKNNAKLITIGNQNPKFASDGGIDRRLRSINFVSRFYTNGENIPYPTEPNAQRDFWADATLKEFIESPDGSLALFQFIAEGAAIYYKEGLETPVQYKDLACEVISSNNQFLEFIEENFTFGEEGKAIVHKDDVVALWKKEKGKEGCFDDIRAELVRRNFIYDANKQKQINGKRKKGCFTNMVIIEEIPDQIENYIIEIEDCY